MVGAQISGKAEQETQEGRLCFRFLVQPLGHPKRYIQGGKRHFLLTGTDAKLVDPDLGRAAITEMLATVQVAITHNLEHIP